MSGRRSVLWRAAVLLRPAWVRLFAGALAAAAASGCAVALMATSAWLIARAAQHPPVLTLMVAIVSVRAFGIGRGLLRYVERLVSHDAAFVALGDVRVRVYRKLERLAPAGLPAWRRGDLLTRLVADVDDMQDLALRGLLPIASAALVFLATLGLAVALLPSAALVLAGALAVAGIATPWLWVRASRTVEDGVAGERAERTATVVELLDASTDLLACGAADQWLSRVDDLESRVALRVLRSARLAGAGVGIAILAVAAAVWGTLVVAVPVVHQGSLAGPALAVLVLTPLALTELVQALPVAAQELQRVRGSAARVLAVLDSPDPVDEPAHVRPLAAPTAAAPHIRVTGLQVNWPGRAQAALEDIDLDLPPGRRVAIVGASGAGKSTLLAALLRFVEPSGGNITIDGTDVRTLDGDDVRSLMALCDQDAYLFDSTIAENVRLARAEASDSEIRDALCRARLDHWIDELPRGIHTRVGEHGALISGGQRQRIALARALLADRPVLLLDEPTAGLDEPTAAALIVDLLAAGTGRTTVLVTHRLADLGAVDEILVLDEGHVVNRGAARDVINQVEGRHVVTSDA
ncbi:MAG: thiol reductant ABC exporter subunit CydC [Mycobacteriaceae bacterium]